MKNAIIIHGTCGEREYFGDEYPSLSNSHWFPWLQKKLLINGIFAQTPEMFEAYKPDYEKWKKEFERFDIDRDTILIGHSCGGGFLVRWLSENKTKIDKLFLVAPWLDPEREKTTSFFDFNIDSNMISRVGKIHMLVSSDDDDDILKSVEMIKDGVPGIKIHEFSNLGHFTFGDMKTERFMDLLNMIIG